KDEGNAPFRQGVGNGRAAATPDLDVEDGAVDGLAVEDLEGRSRIGTDVDIGNAEVAHDVLHQHGDDHLVFDDEDRTDALPDLDVHGAPPFFRCGVRPRR